MKYQQNSKNISTPDEQSDQDDMEEVYEPLESEIIGYAAFLGMNLPEDNDLLYIAEEGVSSNSKLTVLVKSASTTPMASLQQRK
jgi:hypothetical protein